MAETALALDVAVGPRITTTVRQALGHATAALGDTLRNAEPFRLIAAGRLDIAGYTDLLMRLQQFHQAMAPMCAAASAALAMPELAMLAERRLATLQADLAAFGIRETFPSLAPPDLSAAPFILGCHHTVQGSTLGGKITYRQLDGLLPTSEGRTFFRGAPEDGLLWRRFCDALECYGLAGRRLSAIQSGAVHAFELFRACLEAE